MPVDDLLSDWAPFLVSSVEPSLLSTGGGYAASVRSGLRALLLRLAGDASKAAFLCRTGEARHPISTAHGARIAFDDCDLGTHWDRIEHQLSQEPSSFEVVRGDSGSDLDMVGHRSLLGNEFIKIDNWEIFAADHRQDRIQRGRPEWCDYEALEASLGQPALQDVELVDVRFFLWGAAENQLDAELLLRITITFLHPKEIRVG